MYDTFHSFKQRSHGNSKTSIIFVSAFQLGISLVLVCFSRNKVELQTSGIESPEWLSHHLPLEPRRIDLSYQQTDQLSHEKHVVLAAYNVIIVSLCNSVIFQFRTTLHGICNGIISLMSS